MFLGRAVRVEYGGCAPAAEAWRFAPYVRWGACHYSLFWVSVASVDVAGDVRCVRMCDVWPRRERHHGWFVVPGGRRQKATAVTLTGLCRVRDPGEETLGPHT